MNIQYYGDYCFKMVTKPAGRATDDVVIWTDLPEKRTGIRAPFGHADIVLLSHTEIEDDSLSSLKDGPELLYSPGEYSVDGISVLGFPSYRDGQGGRESGQNTIFVFDSEEMRFAFLGALGHPLDDGLIEKIGDIDVLFVPVGGDGALTPKAVGQIIHDIEPKIVIPMHYAITGTSIEAGAAEVFCAEVGCKIGEETSKLSFKKKDLDGKNMEISFLKRT
jgi:hypothetical protein